jgi:cell division septal protein FtsQ
MATRRKSYRTRRPRRASTRSRRKRGISWLRVGLLLGLMGLAGYGVWAVRSFLDSTLEVKSVEVTGNRSLSESQVLSLARLPEGANLLSVSLRRARARLESDLRVRSAKVRRDFPDKVTIQIAERQPFAILKSPTGWHLVDDEGVIFADIASPNDNRRKGLPTITLNSNLKEGERATRSVKCFERAAELFADHVVGVVVSCDGTYSLKLSPGLVVRLGAGTGADLNKRIELAAEILRRDKSLCREAEYLDVSCCEAPACKLRGDNGPRRPADG